MTYKSSVPEATPLDYTVTVNDSTMPPPPVQLPTGETALWKLDEASGATAADSSGNGNNGTAYGTYSRVPGQLGRAVNLAPGATLSAGKPLINTDQTYTVATWVRLNSSTKDQAVLSQMGTYMPHFTLGYKVSGMADFDRRWAFEIINQDNPSSIQLTRVQAEKQAKIGQWTHLAVQYDRAAHKVRLYVDGELAGEGDYTADWNARGAFEVGTGRILGNPANLDGAVDDLRVYQRALTPQEIRALVISTNTTTHTGIPSGQVIDKTFTMDNPASFKFVVKACRTGVTPPSCNESPAYRITSDAPVLPSDTQTGMEEPTLPILSGMVNRPSGGPVTAKYYLYDNNGTPVGAAPLGIRTVNGGERASFQLPANTVQPGTTYKWQMVACANGETAADEVCTSKTAPVTFTTPGTPPPDAEEEIRHLSLGKDSFVIKSAKTDPTACNGEPCAVEDSTVMRLGGSGIDKTVAIIALNLSELPAGAVVTESILQLGAPSCPSGPCPADTVITATPLKSTVTSETKGSDLAADVEPDTTYPFPMNGTQADIARNEHKWLMLTSNREETITLGEDPAAVQPSMTLTYVPAAPPSGVLNLAASAGDGGGTASWGIPESTGSTATFDGYDVKVTDSSGTSVKTLEVQIPYVTLTGLTNGQSYTVMVRAKTAFGVSDWESANLTPKAVPPPSSATSCIPFLDTPPSSARNSTIAESGATEYINRIKHYYQAQDAVLEGRAATIWEAPGVTPEAPSTAKLSLLNEQLVKQRAAMQRAGESRVDSTLSLDNAVVQGAADGSVRVTAGISRTWKIQTQSQTSSAAVAATSGEVDPSEFTVSVFVFDRCGNVTIIDVPMDSEEDSTDFGDWDIDAQGVPTNIFDPPASSGLSNRLAAGPPDPGDTGGWERIGPYLTPMVEYSPVKGAKVLMRGRSIWTKGALGWDETTWRIKNFSNWAKLYTHPTIFWKPKVKGKKSASEAARNKYIYYHSQIRMTAKPCFKSSTTKFVFEGGISLEYKGNLSGSFNVGVEATGDEKCPSEIVAETKSGTGLLEISYASKSIEARCWQSGTQACSLPTYNHFINGEFQLETYVSPKEDAQCHPPEPKRWNYCKKTKILPLKSVSTGWRERDGSLY
ncbi:LamG-like jellyroll fold domain-containing protein [Nonomuraea sp. NPDC049695]|uniref:LamG-like jellyroll fold domain-containing protein n=1 Tax=Nonomuraea sp. NPDC049695 TaxID=3154734 RepID=UPI0034416243